MNRTTSLTISALVLASATLCAIAQGAAATQSNRAGDLFKNVQVLKDIPFSDFNATMHFIRASLGTTCDFCHDVEHYEADTKSTKVTARRMIQMVLDLNKNMFEGRTVVTCNSCHRGSSRPVAIPTVEQGLVPDSTRAEVVAPKERPTPAQVLDRYLAAVGGRTALLALQTRSAEGTWAHMELGTTPDGKPKAVNRGKVDRFTVTTVGNDGLLITREGFDGAIPIEARSAGKTTITVQGNRGVAKTGTVEQQVSAVGAAIQLANYGLDHELKLVDEAGTFTVADPIRLDGRDMSVLTRTLSSAARELIYFDASDGLLRRRAILRQMQLGEDLIQVDFDDYRIVEGVRVPFMVKTSYLDDNHYGYTVKFQTIRHEKK